MIKLTISGTAAVWDFEEPTQEQLDTINEEVSKLLDTTIQAYLLREYASYISSVEIAVGSDDGS